MTRKKEINFDYVAPFYDVLSKVFFQNSITDSQEIFIAEIPPNTQVLIIGGGTGKILKDILLKRNVSKITYLDSSPKMISLSKRRIKHLPADLREKVEFKCGTENDIASNEKFDVICTHFLLDLFELDEAHSIVRKISLHTSINSIWLFSDFCKTNSILHKFLLKGMFIFFSLVANTKVTKLNDYLSMFHAEGWIEENSKRFYNGMIYASLLRKIGN